MKYLKLKYTLTCGDMKKIILIYCVLAVTIISCAKDDSTSPATIDNGTGVNPSSVPATFTQKVLIEEFVGAGQAQCTDGFVKQDNIIVSNPKTSVPVTIHYSDAMEIPQYTTLFTNFSNGSAAMFPSALINRTASLSTAILNRLQWQSNFDVAKGKAASSGLMIKSTVSGTTATVEVHCGFNQTLTGNYTVSIYLCENNVKGIGNLYDQRNAYNTTAGHAYYNLGDPILNYNHNYVLRKVASAAMGDAIPTEKIIKGGEYVKTYNINIGNYKLNDLNIIAFISKNGTSAIDQPIINVQQVKLGSTKNWD